MRSQQNDAGHLWRTSADISDGWDRMYQCLHSVVGLSRFAGPGGWNDPGALRLFAVFSMPCCSGQ